MPVVRFENPETPEDFLAEMEKLHIHFPVVPSASEAGVLCDATGDEILQIDPMQVMSDTVVTALTAYFVMALNNAAGFRAIAAQATLDDDDCAETDVVPEAGAK